MPSYTSLFVSPRVIMTVDRQRILSLLLQNWEIKVQVCYLCRRIDNPRYENGLGCLLVQFQVGNTVIIADVAGNKGEMMMNGSSTDENIKVTNQLASAPEFASDLCKLPH